LSGPSERREATRVVPGARQRAEGTSGRESELLMVPGKLGNRA